MSAELDARLVAVVAAVLDLDPASVGEHTSTDTVEAWDSLAHMNLILAVEEEFAIVLPDEDAADLTSFALLALVVAEQLGAARAA